LPSLSESGVQAQKPAENARAIKSPPVAILAAAALCVILLVGYFFSPDLVNLLEILAGQPAPLEVFIRAHFLVVAFQVILVLFALLYVLPVRDLKKRLLLYFLLAEAILLCSIWIFDKPDIFFFWEKSALTFFSALFLILCSLTAYLNGMFLPFSPGSERIAKLFWFTLSAAFLFAGMDEFFMLHEKITKMLHDVNWFDDMITGLYALGACAFVAVFYKTFKREIFGRDTFFFMVLCSGILFLSVAMLIDSFDFLFRFLDRYISTFHLLNSLEELMEFTAATLFLCALVVNLCQIKGRTLELTMTRVGEYVPSTFMRRSFWGIVFLSTVAAIGIKTVFGVGDEPVIFERGQAISVFADVSDGLKGPDGLIFSPAHGLVVGDEAASSILVFDLKGNGRVYADGATGLVSPEGLAARVGYIFVADDSQGKVLKYAAAGTTAIIVAETGLKSPEGLAVDARGDLYVADEVLSMVVKYAGMQRNVVASSLDGLKTPEELAFDEQGNLYITDEKARAVFKVSPSGETSVFADRSDGLMAPEGIVVHLNGIYVTDNETGTIFRFKSDGSGGKFITFSRRHRNLSGIAFDEQNNLYVVSADPYSATRHIFRIAPDY
jgi:streptogramin lyase